MVSELICLEITKALRGHRVTCTQKFNVDDSGKEKISESHAEDSSTEGDLYRPLLVKYELKDIEASIRWLQLGAFISKTEWGLRGPWVHTLTDKGNAVADTGNFSDEDKKLFYQVDPYAVFIAHQFNEDDQEIVSYIRENILQPNGFRSLDGKADGLEEFRHSILSKIKKARFFICILTKRAVLESGTFVSSVWLYQEIGAAMAFDKKPLLLVEQGIDPQYVGELQRVYEHLEFTRSNHPRVFQSIIRRLKVDLETEFIPLPNPGQRED